MRLTAQQKKNLYYLVPLIVLLIGTFLFYFLAVRVRPNDKILTNSEGVALFANENPTFEVQFGDKENPDGQWVRFEAKASSDNPFSSEEKKNIFTKIASIFTPNKKSGIEMSLRGVDFSETNADEKNLRDEQIQKVADILGTEEVKTSTVLTEMGREIGGNEGDQIISKQTIVNQGVADGIDLEYQVLKGLGLKEEIVINDLEAYRKSCDEGCKLPLNEFVFDIKVDDGLVLKKGWFTVDGKSSEVYYFVDGNGKYLAHFLPSYAVDDSGSKTYEVDLKINEVKAGNYEAKVTVNSGWLLDSNRVYPIRIDPSIVHDDTTDFSGGIFNRTESVAGPKVQTKTIDPCSGGTLTTSGNYYIRTFTSSGTLSCVSAVRADVLVVGAGGGGGNYGSFSGGGGGGAGGVVYSTYVPVSLGNTSITVAPTTAIHTTGSNSSFGSSIIAYGGGRGGSSGESGASGGCGGGGGTGGGGGAGGTQGYGGGNGDSYQTGGGGGMAAAGQSGVNGLINGLGGNGIANSISGTSQYYGGGGGGGEAWAASGALGGGGLYYAPNGANNTGGGGAGGWVSGSAGTGGSGIVIVRYVLPLFSYSEYISSSLNLGSSTTGATMSWLASGVNTGNGETPYSTTGMVAQWNFNETSGVTAVSGGTCGTSCNGTLTNMTTTGQDAAVGTGWTANNRRWGAGAVMFDGSNDYVKTANYDALDSYQSGSVEFWINTSTTSAEASILQYGSSAIGNMFWYLNAGKLYQGWQMDSTGNWAILAGSKLVNDGQWHYVAFVADGTNPVSLYIDGVKDTLTFSRSGGSGGTNVDWIADIYNVASVTNYIAMGSLVRSSNGSYFPGLLDSTRIYSRALSANEILSNYQAGNIEFQYRTSTDNSTWSNWTSYNDGALMFDGTDDYVNVGDIAAVDALTSFSTCAWINNDTLTTDSMIFSKVDNTNWSGIMFVKDIVGQVSGRTNMYKIWVGQNNTAAFIEGATNSATTGAWQHVCATFTANNSTGLHLYINGVEDANSPVSTVGITGFDSGANTLSIGRYNPSAGTYLDGSIDNIQIYNRVLSGSEITSNYTASDFETPYSSTGLLAFWKFNELSDTTAVSGGTCGIACNGILTNFSSTTSRDSSTTSGWTAKTKKGSDYPEYSFDNPYLYNPSDTGLVGYWSMDEASGSGAYIKDVSAPFATGGTVTYSGGYTVHTFTSSGTFVVNSAGNVEVLVVGGGGGGGWQIGGGGGGGGVIYNSSFAVSSGNVTVTVGGGGAGATAGTAAGVSGQNSVFSTLTALGGGGGGSNAGSVAGAGLNGGSGGGGGENQNGGTKGLGTTGQGYDGGIANDSAPNYGSGGGGGAGAVGANGTTTTGGNGGVGVSYSISGSAVYYAGGGGGGTYLSGTAGIGGLGGGGAAGAAGGNNAGVAGTVNTGGGGGGASYYSANMNGGAGGSGIVIVRYPSFYVGTQADTIGDITPTGTTFVTGKSGGARSFNGSSDFLSCTDASCGGAGRLDSMSGSMSISAWVKPVTCSTASVSPGIVDKFDTSTSKGYLIYNEYYSGANTWTFYDPVNNSYARSTTPCAVGVWTYITAVYDSSALTKKIYINGKLEATSTSQNPFGDSASDFNIGRYRGSSYYYNGIIDEVRVFNTALSATSIMSDYINGIPNKSSTISQSGATLKMGGTGSNKLASGYTVDANTIGLWRMDERSGTGAYIRDSTGSQLPFATGGTVTYSGGDTIHTFTSGGTLTVNGSGNVQVLVVGGGGGGGNAGGGGGGGGVIYNSAFALTSGAKTVTVGGGGGVNANGGNSVFDTITATGGGGGGNGGGNANPVPYTGGSGGGAGSTNPSTNGAAGTSGQGYAGGNAYGLTGSYGSGGGGGAGAVGSNGGSNVGHGGVGAAYSISGTSTYYAGGGGGTIYNVGSYSQANGGTGGGGKGEIRQDGTGAILTAGTQGAANTGGGGGGSNYGGSGIVIVRYPSTYTGGTSGFHGTPTGTTYTNSGKVGGARSFNGTSDYVSLPTTGGSDTKGNLGFADTDNFTLELWYKGTDTTQNTDFGKVLVGRDNTDIYANLILRSGYVEYLHYNSAWLHNIKSTTMVADGNWHHIVYVNYSNETGDIYIDGIKEISASSSSLSSATRYFKADGLMRGYNAQYTSGTLDEVRISNIARTANEIAESYKLGKDSYINQTLNTIDLSTKNTLAINVASDRPGTYLSTIWGESAFANYQPDINTAGLWHMDEISGSGAYIKDVSGRGYSGTPTGTTYTSNGSLGGARNFNGSSDYINAGNIGNVSSSFSVGMFIKPGSLAAVSYPIAYQNGSDASSLSFRFELNTTGVIDFGAYNTSDAAVKEAPSTTALQVGNWYYIVGTFNGTALSIYVNGRLEATTTTAAIPIYYASSNVAIGARLVPAAGGFFNGIIDEVRISNTARTADQIRQAYEVGLRTHNVIVTFGAGLASGNLITGSGDYSFNIDATRYSLPSLGSELYAGDKVIIKENYDGTEYIAQGTVVSVNLSTGATVVSSWDSGSTFPSGGYTVNADVFKWQKEYIPVKNRTISTQVDATNLLSFRVNDGNQGRNIWIDDLRSSTGYLKNSSSEIISFASNSQYVQYKSVFSSWDTNVTPYLSQVQVDYTSNGPTIDQLMKHGMWFDGTGTKKSFWWVNGGQTAPPPGPITPPPVNPDR